MQQQQPRGFAYPAAAAPKIGGFQLTPQAQQVFNKAAPVVMSMFSGFHMPGQPGAPMPTQSKAPGPVYTMQPKVSAPTTAPTTYAYPQMVVPKGAPPPSAVVYAKPTAVPAPIVYAKPAAPVVYAKPSAAVAPSMIPAQGQGRPVVGSVTVAPQTSPMPVAPKHHQAQAAPPTGQSLRPVGTSSMTTAQPIGKHGQSVPQPAPVSLQPVVTQPVQPVAPAPISGKKPGSDAATQPNQQAASQPEASAHGMPVAGDGPYKNDNIMDTRFFGIWDRSNAFTYAEKPFVRGWGVGLRWADAEATMGKFDWSEFDGCLEKAAAAGQSFYGMVHVGPDSPPWIFKEGGVPSVDTQDAKAGDKHAKFALGYPFYGHPNYKKYFFRMIDNFAQFLRNHKHAKNVGFVQVNLGCTGDATFYKGVPNKKEYQFDETQAANLTYEFWTHYAEAFQTGPGKIVPLLVNIPGDQVGGPYEEFAMKNMNPVGFKGNFIVRGHHLSGERSWIEHYRPYMVNPKKNSKMPFLITRTEMDQTWANALYQLNLKLGFYWGVINGLNQCLAVHDVSKEALKGCEQGGYLEELQFFNKYAGQIWPSTATNAFVALHQGIDCGDQVRYPTTKYGRKQEDRIKALLKEFQPFGCAVDDMDAAMRGQVYQRESQVSYNDIGDDIWPTNYGRFIEQIDEDLTSQGLWRIGGKITSKSSKYSRFARGLVHKNNKTAMYFKMADGFFDNSPPGLLHFRIVWYDAVKGSWQFEYKAKGGASKVALDQPCKGDGQWKEAEFIVSDAAMDRSGERGSDFIIKSKDKTDAIFHMIELSRDL